MRRERRSSDSGSLFLQMVSVIAVALGGLAVWLIVLRLFDLPPILLPSPLRVFQAAMQKRNELAIGMLSTGVAAVAGLASAIIVGCLISVLFSQSRTIRRAFFPYVIFLQTVPIVAIAPLLITWSGYKFRTVVIVTVIICLFPIISNVTAGLMTIERELADLFRLYGANRFKRLWKLQIPSAVPYLVLGAKISSGLAVIGAIVAEFFVGNGTSFYGLGSLMTGWQAMQKTDALIAALFLSTLLGLLLFGSVHLFSHYILRRWTRPETTSWQKS
jgi:NitT/TauT family transport system permease protein